MLNCTDLACVLHHHHFYAHLHHLKHHLQDDNDNTAIGDGSDVDNNNADDIQGLLNDTDSELSSLSHLDAPNDVVYMVCGVVIAMLLVVIIIVLVAVTIRKTQYLIEQEKFEQQTTKYKKIDSSKLRKREDTSVSPVNVESQTTQPAAPQVLTPDQANNAPIAFRQNPSSVWVFPPLPPQPNIYCANSQDALIQVNEKNGFKGFRKQFSGRFKRLVQKKSHEPAPAIPPELKPQLKTIYVY